MTRLGQAGRLVLTAQGQVDVDASLARIEATRGQRHDLEQRWADQRAAAKAQAAPDTSTPHQAQDDASRPAEPTADAPQHLDVDTIGKRTRLAQMLKAESEARIKAREDALAEGQQVPLPALERALAIAATTILNAAETMPDRLTPIVHGVPEAETVRAILRDEIDQFLRTVADALDTIAGREEAA